MVAQQAESRTEVVATAEEEKKENCDTYSLNSSCQFGENDYESEEKVEESKIFNSSATAQLWYTRLKGHHLIMRQYLLSYIQNTPFHM